MIYAETLRHFVLEWIKIEPPKRFKNWPWSENIWILNLYAQSSSQVTAKMPIPFVSILLDDSAVRRGQMVNENLIVYKGYFNKGEFSVPRRYVLDGTSNSERTFRTNRYCYTSDGYGKFASDWNKADLRLIKFMGSTNHIRRHIYSDDAILQMLLTRLGHLAGRYEMEYRIAENVMDFTEKSRETTEPYNYAPQTFLVASPATGLLDPIRKSKDYKLINGCISMNQDDVFITIPGEPCEKEFEKVINPLRNFPGTHMRASKNICHSVIYCCAECPCGIFRFQEYFPSMVWKDADSDLQYCRVITHIFTLTTEAVGSKTEIRQKHYIDEGLLPKDRSTKLFLQKHREKLFQRSDLPPGVAIGNDGNVTCTIK